jgi:translation initiation factor IF-2
MDNIRVYEAAKELGLTNKEMIEQLEKKIGIKVKSHSSTLTLSQFEKFKASLKTATATTPKKPKAFIVKKVKPKNPESTDKKTAVEVSVQKVEIQEKEAKVVEKPKAEIKEPVIEKSEAIKKAEENSKKEEKAVVEKVEVQKKVEEKIEKSEKPATPTNTTIRSLLEYNNQNSQKRRAEIQAENNRKKREQEKAELEKKKAIARQRQQQNQGGERPQRPFRGGERPQRPDRRQEGNNENRAQRPNTGEKREPVKRHFISQEIYENKPGYAKRKDVNKKEKDYKSKEEQQELISLEKAMAQKHRKKEKVEEVQQEVKSVVINSVLTVGELAEKINKSSAEVVKFLMMNGILATVNQVIDVDTQKKVCANFEIEVQEEDLEAFIEEELEKEEKLKELSEVDESLLKSRAPVVSILGHVDHGKTTLLDAIRETKQKITSTEVGGITQSIGAYTVHHNNKKIVFVDTPGHEAFTAMRARGAQATDIAILVVAADDGIMPQTIEAINHARAAEVPIVVAINKCDKPDANPDKIMQQLTEHGLVPEEWGGDTACIKVSALMKTGIEDLLEYILLLAEVNGYKANPTARATGVIIEANLDKGKGPVATLLVQNGTLHTGDCFVVGTVEGKVRALIADNGERLKKAGPSTPVEILGLSEVPQSGDKFEAVENEKIMHQIVAERKEKERNSRLEATMPAHVRNDAIGEDDNIQRLNLIIKANTHGAAEAVAQSINQMESKEIITKIIHVGVGDISEADVMLASAGKAIILGFTVKEDSNAMAAAEKYNVTIKKYDIIYQILEDLEKTMLQLLQPEEKIVEIGTVEVRQIFTIGKTTKIAGCYVTEGKVARNKMAVVIRNGKEIFKGSIDQLKRFKDDVKEVAQGFECGISFAKFNDLEVGDIIKVTTTELVERQELV